MKKIDILTHKKHFIEILTQHISQNKALNSGEQELLNCIKYALIDDKAKYIRSFIVFETTKMLGGELTKDIVYLAIAIEMMHAYSLIHDDLPAMDNSSERRGKPACHRKFKESTAILTGNALQVMAFECIFNISNVNHALILSKDISKVVGLYGILSGQVLDLDPKTKKAEFDIMNYKKTGVLFEFCLKSVAVLCERLDILPNLCEYGKKFGMLYQMQDDILDLEEDGYSYISHFHSKASLELKIQEVVHGCKNAISQISSNDILTALPDFIVNQKS